MNTNERTKPDAADEDLSEVFQRILKLRTKIFSAIEATLAEEGHYKSYEGRIEIVCPTYFEEGTPEVKGWGINLACYVLGPSRRYEWRGSTLNEALLKAEEDVSGWLLKKTIETTKK